MSDVLTLYRDRPFVLAWLGVMLLAVAAAGLRALTGLAFTDAAAPLAGTAGISAIALVYGLSGRSAILSNMAHWAVLWVLFSLAAGIISYAVAALGGPTYDATFTTLDARLGFSWPRWYRFVAEHPTLRFALAAAYSTLMPQIVFSILYFGLTARQSRNREFFFAVAIGFVLTIIVSWRLPALGALPYFGHADEARRFYFDDLQALRGHRAHPYSLADLKGLITLPSFHTVLAIVFTYVHRGPSVLARGIALVNAAVLVSIPVGGGHYLSDMVAGAGIAVTAILAVRWLEGRSPATLIRRDKEMLATADDLGSS